MMSTGAPARYSFAPRAASVHGCRYRQTLARPSLHICAMAAQSRRADGCSSAHSRHTSALLPDVRSPHSECNFANKSVFAPVQANFPVLLGDHLFDDTATTSLSPRSLHAWTARLYPPHTH